MPKIREIELKNSPHQTNQYVNDYITTTLPFYSNNIWISLRPTLYIVKMRKNYSFYLL